MNQQEQKWLVLLYSLIEMDGGSQRKNVLQHIQEKGYWYKNDQNDAPLLTRNEKAWRNDFPMSVSIWWNTGICRVVDRDSGKLQKKE